MGTNGRVCNRKRKSFRKLYVFTQWPSLRRHYQQRFSSIAPNKFELCFVNWASLLSESFKSQVIAIDGKNIKTFEHLDIGHGRIETRKCRVIADFIFIKNLD